MVNLPAHGTQVAPFDLPRVGVDAIVIVFEDHPNISSAFDLWDFSGYLQARFSKNSFIR